MARKKKRQMEWLDGADHADVCYTPALDESFAIYATGNPNAIIGTKLRDIDAWKNREISNARRVASRQVLMKTIAAKAVERSLRIARLFFREGGGVIIAIVIKILSARGGDSARARAIFAEK